LLVQEAQVKDYFEVGTDPQGRFYARRNPKKWLERGQFVAMCTLAKDFGGEYVKLEQTWRIPGLGKEPRKEQGAPQPGVSVPTAAPVSSAEKLDQPYRLFLVDDLLSGQFQSRLTFDDPEFEELTENVKVYGVLEPILVRIKPSGKPEVVAGERRLAAAKKAGSTQVPALVKQLTDEEALVIQFTENLHRKDWTEEEKIRALGELARRTKWNAQQIADKLKRSNAWVCRYLPNEFKDKEKMEAGKLGGAALRESYTALQRGAKSEDIRYDVGTSGRTNVPEHHEVTGKSESGEASGGEYAKSGSGVKTSGSGFEHSQEAKPDSDADITVPAKTPDKNLRSEGSSFTRTFNEEPLLTGFEVECPECHVKVLVNHILLPGGRVTHEVESSRGVEA